jgi:hypothetical protein
MINDSIARGCCSQCGAQFLIGADSGFVSTEVSADIWCHDGRIRRPPKKVECLICFFCLDAEEHDPGDAAPPQRWHYGNA